MMNHSIRPETPADHRAVEELTREAFWNVHVPGCDEHYLAHILRGHPDFIPALDFVAELDGRIVGNIMYARSRLVSDTGRTLDSLTFGPISVLPEFQNRGVGSALIRHSLEQARALGYRVVVIDGHPYNYCKHGFVGSRSLNVADENGRFPYSLLVRELVPSSLENQQWKFHPSEVYFGMTEEGLAEFEASFSPKEKAWRPSQEEFKIASRAFVE